jgi:hypothetical protein
MMSSGDTNNIDTPVHNRLEGLLGSGTVDIGVQYYQFDGTQDLSGYQVVYLQANYNYPETDMPAAGQNALLSFLGTAGHGLVTCEWALYKAGTPSYNQFQTLKAAFPGEYDGGYWTSSPVTFTKVTADSILNAGLSDSFGFPVDSYGGTESNLKARDGATTFYSNDHGEPGLIGWGYSAGRVLNFSTTNGPNQVNDTEFGRLLSNSMQWAATPEPSTFVLFGVGLAALVVWRRRRRET